MANKLDNFEPDCDICTVSEDECKCSANVRDCVYYPKCVHCYNTNTKYCTYCVHMSTKQALTRADIIKRYHKKEW